MNDPHPLWSDPRLIYAVALTAVMFLVTTVWLFRRRRRSGRGAAVICLLISVGLHVALIVLVPIVRPTGGGTNVDAQREDPLPGGQVSVAVLDPDLTFDAAAGIAQQASLQPLPVAELQDWFQEPNPPSDQPAAAAAAPSIDTTAIDTTAEDVAAEGVAAPDTLAVAADQPSDNAEDPLAELDQLLSDWIEQVAPDEPPATDPAVIASARRADLQEPAAATPTAARDDVHASAPGHAAPAASETQTAAASVVGDVADDFANRIGAAKQFAIAQTGGDADTEAAVERGLKFLTSLQRADGGWDARAAGAGQERRPLGESRADPLGVVAGTRSDTASTGLALLALLGNGQTHQTGRYSDHVYRGLVYLMQVQDAQGSLAADASLYEANYCHGMAALAMAEAAVMTGDPSAIESTRRAVRFTHSMQHSVTGGIRYTRGDPGDLSQLGWHAMVIEAARRGGVDVPAPASRGVQTFLRSVRSGRSGGLAAYRPGERPTRTMTAEALATRLLWGESIPPAELFEAEQFLLEQTPGVGQDNYYYWYYATLALHQLQDAAWRRWNAALKQRLLATQNPDGSWPTTSVWGGYGGSIYTTSMATLCLESYYRHRSAAAGQTIATAP